MNTFFKEFIYNNTISYRPTVLKDICFFTSSPDYCFLILLDLLFTADLLSRGPCLFAVFKLP